MKTFSNCPEYWGKGDKRELVELSEHLYSTKSVFYIEFNSMYKEASKVEGYMYVDKGTTDKP